MESARQAARLASAPARRRAAAADRGSGTIHRCARWTRSRDRRRRRLPGSRGAPSARAAARRDLGAYLSYLRARRAGPDPALAQPERPGAGQQRRRPRLLPVRAGARRAGAVPRRQPVLLRPAERAGRRQHDGEHVDAGAEPADGAGHPLPRRRASRSCCCSRWAWPAPPRPGTGCCPGTWCAAGRPPGSAACGAASRRRWCRTPTGTSTSSPSSWCRSSSGRCCGCASPAGPCAAGSSSGLLVVLQVFINEEILLFTALTLGVFVLAYAAMALASATRGGAGGSLAGLGVAALTAAGAARRTRCGCQFFGPGSYHGQPFLPGKYVTDLLSIGRVRPAVAGRQRRDRPGPERQRRPRTTPSSAYRC